MLIIFIILLVIILIGKFAEGYLKASALFNLSGVTGKINEIEKDNKLKVIQASDQIMNNEDAMHFEDYSEDEINEITIFFNKYIYSNKKLMRTPIPLSDGNLSVEDILLLNKHYRKSSYELFKFFEINDSLLQSMKRKNKQGSEYFLLILINFLQKNELDSVKIFK